MLNYPNVDPVAISLGPVKIRWYGIMYVIGLVTAWWLMRYRARHRSDLRFTATQVDDLIVYGAIGIILGGRIGSMLFYYPGQLLENPLTLFRIWEGGMSFHGGLLGVLVAMWLFGRRIDRGFFELTDFIAPLVPIGLGTGRIGNFINGELWGKPTDLPWGFRVGDQVLHPSQLYEAFLEGLVLFTVLWIFSAKPKPRMAVSGLFALLYGTFRIAVEFIRVPDAQYGYLAFGWLTMGQALSMPLIVAGAVLLILAYRRGESGDAATA